MENEYNLLKQQAAQANRLIQANLAQRLRNAGLAEMPLTLQNRIEMGGRGNIGAIDTQQKAMMDYRASLEQQNAANLAAQNLGIEAGRMAFNIARELDESNTMFDMWYQLWRKGKITAKQFKQKTGYDVKEWSRGSRRRSREPVFDPNAWFSSYKTIPIAEAFKKSDELRKATQGWGASGYDSRSRYMAQ